MTGSTWLIAVIITLAACPIVVLLWWAASSHHRDVRRARIAAEMTATYEAVHDSPGDCGEDGYAGPDAADDAAYGDADYDYADDYDEYDAEDGADDVRPARTASAGADVWDDPGAWDDPEVWTDPRERTRLVRPVRRFAPAPPVRRAMPPRAMPPAQRSMPATAQSGPVRRPAPPAPRSVEDTVILSLRGSMLPGASVPRQAQQGHPVRPTQPPPLARHMRMLVPEEAELIAEVREFPGPRHDRGGRHHLREDHAV